MLGCGRHLSAARDTGGARQFPSRAHPVMLRKAEARHDIERPTRLPIAPGMLFNSFDFIFLFLPMTLAAFAAAVRLRSSSLAVLVLLVASYVFYGYGDHFAVLLLAGSTAFNYLVGRAIAGTVRRGQGTLGRLLLGIGICGDLVLLAYFKYAGFLVMNLDRLTGAQWPIPVIALPVGISFYTFTQIAFLVDTFRGVAATL